MDITAYRLIGVIVVDTLSAMVSCSSYLTRKRSMRFVLKSVSIIAGLVATATVVPAHEPLIYEQFDSLDSWEALEFRGIERATTYSVVVEGGKSLLLVESDDGGSAIIHKETFNVYAYPIIEWRWRIEDIITTGDLTTRDGDTYPVRVYVNFEYDPDRAGLGTRMRYGLVRRIYGEYPPHGSLLYIWSNQTWSREWYESPFTPRARMLPIDQGRARRMHWRDWRRNILEDYRDAFGEDPPENAQLAIMGDSYGSGESSRAWVDYVRILPE